MLKCYLEHDNIESKPCNQTKFSTEESKCHMKPLG